MLLTIHPPGLLLYRLSYQPDAVGVHVFQASTFSRPLDREPNVLPELRCAGNVAGEPLA